MRYAVVIEQGETRFGAHVPDLPGCVAIVETRDEVLKLIEQAIEFHLEGLRDDGLPIPAPSPSVEFVEVRAAYQQIGYERRSQAQISPSPRPGHD